MISFIDSLYRTKTITLARCPPARISRTRASHPALWHPPLPHPPLSFARAPPTTAQNLWFNALPKAAPPGVPFRGYQFPQLARPPMPVMNEL